MKDDNRGILETLGIAGGLSFLLFYTALWLHHRKRQKRLNRRFERLNEQFNRGLDVEVSGDDSE